LKILSELVLLLTNTDSLQQFENSSDKNFQIVESCQYLVELEQALTNIQIVEGCRYLLEVEQALTKIFKLLKVVNTDRLQQFEDFCQSLFYFY
jgi:hypothetical protein